MPTRVYPAFEGEMPAELPLVRRHTRGQNRAREARYQRMPKHTRRKPRRCAFTHPVTPMRCRRDGWVRRGQPIVYLERGGILPDRTPLPGGWVHIQCAEHAFQFGPDLLDQLQPALGRLQAAAEQVMRAFEPMADAFSRVAEHLWQFRPEAFDHAGEARTFEPDPSFDLEAAWQTFGSVDETPAGVIEVPTTPQYTPLAMIDWTPGRYGRQHEHDPIEQAWYETPITTTYDPDLDWGAVPQPPGLEPDIDIGPVVPSWDPDRCWKCDAEPGLEALDGLCDRCHPEVAEQTPAEART